MRKATSLRISVRLSVVEITSLLNIYLYNVRADVLGAGQPLHDTSSVTLSVLPLYEFIAALVFFQLSVQGRNWFYLGATLPSLARLNNALVKYKMSLAKVWNAEGGAPPPPVAPLPTFVPLSVIRDSSLYHYRSISEQMFYFNLFFSHAKLMMDGYTLPQFKAFSSEFSAL